MKWNEIYFLIKGLKYTKFFLLIYAYLQIYTCAE